MKKEPPTLPEFDETDYLKNWDEQNPEIMIQENTDDDLDNDWVLSPEEWERLIQLYFNPDGA